MHRPNARSRRPVSPGQLFSLEESVMTALKRFAFLSVLLGLGLLGVAAAPFPSVETAEPRPQGKLVYEVWGKDVRDMAEATPENEDPGAWILLGSSHSRAGAQQTLATIKRHG